MGSIYLITNQVDGKQYVGQTIEHDPFIRINTHFKPTNKKYPLYNAIRKYGREVFSVEIIWKCPDQGSLNASEIAFIALFDSLCPKGYNLRLGGSRGKHNPETIKKMQETATKANRGEFFKRLWKNSDHQSRQTEIGILNWQKEDIRTRRAAGIKSSWQDPVVAASRIEGAKRAFADPDFKKRRAEIGKETMSRSDVLERHRVATIKGLNRPGIKELLSKQTTERWLDPDTRERMSSAIRTTLASPDVYQRMSEIRSKLRWITDGITTSRIQDGAAIPEGWRYGRLSKRR